jgi:hypothetical protein
MEIGYAVFGTPKGIQIISNGIFKTNDLGRSLYLSSEHILLDHKEKVIMVKRVASDLNKPNSKDIIIIALYEKALQCNENRPGGFIGSAIAFKDVLPDTNKLVRGLIHMYSKIKENVDADNRFLTPTSENWSENYIPDATNKSVFLNQKNEYVPIGDSGNAVIKINRFIEDSAAVLTHLLLNYNYHKYDHIYLTDSNDVLAKLENFKRIDYSQPFSYASSIKRIKDFQIKELEALTKVRQENSVVKKETQQLTNNISSLKNEKQLLTKKIARLKSEEEQLNEKIANLKNDYETKSKEMEEELERNLTTKKKELRKLQQEIDSISRGSENEIEEKDPDYNYKKISIFVGGLLLISFLLIYFYTQYNDGKSDPEQIEIANNDNSKEQNEGIQTTVLENEKSDKLKKKQEDIYKTLQQIKSKEISSEDDKYIDLRDEHPNYWELFYLDTLRIDLYEKTFTNDKQFKEKSNYFKVTKPDSLYYENTKFSKGDNIDSALDHFYHHCTEYRNKLVKMK